MDQNTDPRDSGIPGSRWHLLWYPAAMLVHTLVLDLVIETSIATNNINPWLIGTTFFYGLALAAGSYYSNHLNARRLTLAGSLFLSATLIACASPFGGSQVQLLGFGTDEVTLVLLAITVLIVGSIVTLGSGRPAAVRAFFLLATAYGVYSFVQPLFSDDRTVQSLFSGKAFWSYLPFWLQGPWFAIATILGLGTCILLVSILRRVRGPNLYNGLTGLAVVAGTFVFSAQFALIAIGLETDSKTSGGSSIALERSSDDALVFPASSFDALELVHAALPRNGFDPAAIVKEVGRDPLKLTRWVAEHTILVPYRGALRDPAGVIMDRSGNSLDRSLLLVELFRIAGLPSRVVRGQLSDEGFATLKFGRKKPSLTPLGMNEKLVEAIKTAGLDLETIRTRWDRSIDNEQVRSNNIRQVVEEQSAFLIENTATNFADSNSAASTRQHWWVSTDSGEQFDPSFPGTASLPTSPESSFQPDDLPSDLYHRIEIRVLLEAREDESLEEVELVRAEVVPALTGTTVVQFANIPMDWPGSAEIASADEPAQAFKETLLDQQEWLPQLSINGRPTISRYFSLNGDVFDVADLHASSTRLGMSIGRATKTVSTATDLFSSLPGGENDENSGDTRHPLKRGSSITAQWIEYTVKSPGRPTETIRRRVFDLLDDDQRSKGNSQPADLSSADRLRRATALFAQNDILVQGGDVNSEYLMDVMIDDVIRLRGPIRGVFEEKSVKSVPQPRSLNAYLWSLFRSKYSSTEFVLDQINLASFRQDFVVEGTEIVQRQSIDVVKNDVLPLGADSDVASQRLRQGVVDTAVENFVLPACAISDKLSKCKAMANASTLLNDNRNGWELIRSAQELQSHSYIPASTMSLLTSHLERGNILLVPGNDVWQQRQELTSWWEIDPITGSTLGHSELGGSAMEYAVLTVNILGTTGCFMKYASGNTSGKDTVTAVACVSAGIIGGVIGVRNAFAEEKAKEYQIVEAVTAIIVGIINFGSDVADAKGW